jgi:hypothetical protein
MPRPSARPARAGCLVAHGREHSGSSCPASSRARAHALKQEAQATHQEGSCTGHPSQTESSAPPAPEGRGPKRTLASLRRRCSRRPCMWPDEGGRGGGGGGSLRGHPRGRRQPPQLGRRDTKPACVRAPCPGGGARFSADPRAPRTEAGRRDEQFACLMRGRGGMGVPSPPSPSGPTTLVGAGPPAWRAGAGRQRRLALAPPLPASRTGLPVPVPPVAGSARESRT